jgi:hypothetical protein
MNAQEIFDTVAKHLAQQAGQATLGDACAYRGDDGRKCAAGILINDEEYEPAMEGKMADEVLPSRLMRHLDLILSLQMVHDNSDTGADVVRNLRGAARKYNLSAAILATLTFPEVWS